VARLIARFPVIADRLAEGRLSIRALVELRDVLTEENHAGVLTRAEGMSQEGAQLLAVEYRPKPIPRDVVRALPMSLARSVAVSVAEVPTETNAHPLAPEAAKPIASYPAVSVETERSPRPPEVVKPLTPDLRRLNATVSVEFIAELEQVRAALSHKFPDGNFEQRDPPAPIRPRSRGGPRGQTHDRKHPAALSEPSSHEGRTASRQGLHGEVQEDLPGRARHLLIAGLGGTASADFRARCPDDRR
jgi:hypothetical protein